MLAVLLQSLLQTALWLQCFLCIAVMLLLLLLLMMAKYCKSSSQQARGNLTRLEPP